MPDEPLNEKTPPASERRSPTRHDEGNAQPTGSETSAPPPTKELTPEEQMARFEDALKEEDWGHQPC
jgi:hypothetical protein